MYGDGKNPTINAMQAKKMLFLGGGEDCLWTIMIYFYEPNCI